MSDQNINARIVKRLRSGVRRLAAVSGAAGLLSIVGLFPASAANSLPSSTPGSPANAPADLPAEYRAVLGKQIWYAPHAGCLDRLRASANAGKATRGERRYPERETALTIRDAVRVDGRWHYRFDWVGESGAGTTPADRVVADTRFQALPTTFYKTCFFLESPQALAGYLQAAHPQALQRYRAPSAADRQREISAIEGRDRQPAR